VQLTDWNEAGTNKISLEKWKFIKNFKFEINCLNHFGTPCARQYCAVPHKITVLVRTPHARWELEDNIKVDNREMILGCEDYRCFSIHNMVLRDGIFHHLAVRQSVVTRIY